MARKTFSIQIKTSWWSLWLGYLPYSHDSKIDPLGWEQFCWWRKANDLPYKHVIAAYGAAMAGIPSQIVYGSCQKICHCEGGV